MKAQCSCCGAISEIEIEEWVKLIEDEDDFICTDCAAEAYETITMFYPKPN
jgi:hypothetical protein